METVKVDHMTPTTCPRCGGYWIIPSRIVESGGTVRCPHCSQVYRRQKRVVREDDENFNPRPIWTAVK